MIEVNSADYYLAREGEETLQANSARTLAAAAVHIELARRYRELSRKADLGPHLHLALPA